MCCLARARRVSQTPRCFRQPAMQPQSRPQVGCMRSSILATRTAIGRSSAGPSRPAYCKAAGF
eukprot:15474584-Alexandrium_andersonii.AAC.1